MGLMLAAAEVLSFGVASDAEAFAVVLDCDVASSSSCPNGTSKRIGGVLPRRPGKQQHPMMVTRGCPVAHGVRVLLQM